MSLETRIKIIQGQSCIFICETVEQGWYPLKIVLVWLSWQLL